MFKFVRSKSVWLILPFYCCFRFLFSEISLRTFCSVWNFQGCITVYLSRCCSSQETFLLKNICSVSQKAYLVYHKQFCLSRTFLFYFQASFETRLLITRSNSSLVYQNFQLVSSIFYFLNFFSEIRVAFDCRNSHKFYQDYSSMSSTFSSFLKKKFHRISCGGPSV